MPKTITINKKTFTKRSSFSKKKDAELDAKKRRKNSSLYVRIHVYNTRNGKRYGVYTARK